jgi:hypothetical protein
MAYSDFNLKKVKDELGLQVLEEKGVFDSLKPVEPSKLLADILDENVPLALAINTEKARSELIVSNVLVELRKVFDRKISIFSGIEFNVDKERGLNGFCDFIVSASSEQLMLDFPVVTIVEAKNENLIGRIGQCIAEMFASDIQNKRENRQTECVYGTVTSGNAWKFIKLKNNTVYIDMKEYYIDNIGKILGILTSMVKQEA